MSRLVDKEVMQLIYDKCVQVYNRDISANAACKLLAGKTPSSDASLKMYFTIYACMRQGTCYKMGTSAAFTRFLIESMGFYFVPSIIAYQKSTSFPVSPRK